MTVYIINNMTIHDREEYKTYLRGFMPIFQQYGGSVLAAEDAPQPKEGSWPYHRTILLSFPDREAAERWAQSPEYQAIAKHRHAGTVSNVIYLNGFPQTA
jgi:uncharacterized protein (DUF1330 family)